MIHSLSNNRRIVCIIAIISIAAIVSFSFWVFVSREKGTGELPKTGELLTYKENIEVIKTDGKETVLIGEELSYLITIENNDHETIHVDYVIDYPPSNFDVTESSINYGGSLEGSRIVWDNGGDGYYVERNGVMEFGYSGYVVGPLPVVPFNLENDAEISVNRRFTYAVSDTTQVEAYPDIRVEKVSDQEKQVIYPGAIVVYTLLLENIGDVPAQDVKLVDTVSEYLTVKDSGGGTVEGQVISWSYSQVDPGEQILISYEVLVLELAIDQQIEILNTVMVSSDNEEENSANNESTSIIIVQNRETEDSEVVAEEPQEDDGNDEKPGLVVTSPQSDYPTAGDIDLPATGQNCQLIRIASLILLPVAILPWILSRITWISYK